MKIKYMFKIISNNLSLYRENFQKELSRLRNKHIELGYTNVGPHVDDLLFTIDGHNSKIFASQGQLRTLVLALKIAEIEIYKQQTNKLPLVLLDDFSSELDSSRCFNVFEYIVSANLQSFITATEMNFDTGLLKESRVFNIEKGKLKC